MGFVKVVNIFGILAFLVCMSAAIEFQIHRFKRVCYLSKASLTRYNPAARFQLSDDSIPAHLCTHIVFTYCKMDTRTMGINKDCLKDDDDDLSDISKVFIYLNQMKKLNPSLKVILSVGGPNQPSEDFAALGRSDKKLAAFSRHLIEYIRRHDLNGVELDWQYPGDVTDTEMDGKHIMSEISRFLKEEFVKDGKNRDAPRLLLSLAVGASQKHLVNSYSFKTLNAHVDFLTVRSCDYHGSWDMRTGMNSPLYPADPSDKLNIASTVAYMLSEGANPGQIVVTLCSKGSTFTLISDTDTDINSLTSGPGIQGPFVQRLGSMAYFEICVVLREKGTRMWQDTQKNPYLVRDRLWIGYDDTQSIEEKARWVVDNQLGGVALWTLDLDDFTGKFCKKGEFPLANAMGKIIKKADLQFFQDDDAPLVISNKGKSKQKKGYKHVKSNMVDTGFNENNINKHRSDKNVAFEALSAMNQTTTTAGNPAEDAANMTSSSSTPPMSGDAAYGDETAQVGAAATSEGHANRLILRLVHYILLFVVIICPSCSILV